MTRLLFGFSALALLFVAPPLHADPAKPADPTDKPAAPPPEPPPKPRPTTVDLTLVMVPWGMHYTRSAFIGSVAYKTPLVRKPGILWDTTSFSIGVRDVYGYVNNTLAPYVEITPIAVFKLNLSASYDYLITNPFNGGMRTLTPAGEQRVLAGDVHRGSKTSVDWVTEKGGLDNAANFRAHINQGGFRARVAPTLQGKIGPVAIQYNFTADWNFYSAPGLGSDTMYHDSFTFTLRRLHDFSHAHELVVAYGAPMKAPGELLLGASSRFMHVKGTGQEQLTLNALVFFRYPKKFWSNRLSPFGAANVGTNLIDPMWQYAFSWLLVLGADYNLYSSPVEEKRP